MNQSDRAALAAIAQQIADLSQHLEKLEYLTDEETVRALKGLVRIAPTLGDLAEGYKAASWFGKLIKWLGALAAAILGIIAFIQFNMGMHK